MTIYGPMYENDYNKFDSAKQYANKHQKPWFAVLQVNPNASKVVVDAAYKALAKVRHPDTGGTEEAMKELNQAYDSIRYKLT